MTTYVYVPTDSGARLPTAEEQQAVDRFVAAFMLKKGVPPASTWRVPGVGYCLFLKTPLDFS
jgi:hypothetical protein